MKKKPSKEELIDALESIREVYPVKFTSSKETDRIQIKAFQMLVGQFPEVTTFPVPFIRIYAPGKSSTQMAEEILKTEKIKIPVKRVRERGLSEENKLLLKTDRLLFDPIGVLKENRTKMEEKELTSLFKIANYLRNKGDSIDKLMDALGSSDEERKLVAEALGAFYEVNILFREELYKDYEQKGKTIKKVPEMGDYYRDIMKWDTTRKTKKNPRGGKKITKVSIERDVEDFRKHLSTGHYPGYRDRVFYDKKRFRFLAFLVTEIGSILDAKLTKTEKNKMKHLKRRKCFSTFSIDKYLDEVLWKPRDTHGVGISKTPLPQMEGTGHTSSIS